MALSVAQVAGNKVASNSSLTVTLGAAPAAGKILLAGLTANGGTARTFTASGWTSIGRVDHTTNSALEVFMRTAPGGTAAFGFGLDSSSVNWLATVYELTDADGTADAVEEAFGSSGDPTLSIDPVDASAAKHIFLFVGNRANASFTPDASPAMTEDYDDAQTGGTAFSMHASHTTATFTSGAAQTVDSNSSANASWVAIAVCIKESTTGAQTVSPSSIASAEAFGSATLTTGAVSVSPSSVASAEAFGSAVLTTTVTLSPAAIASAEAFGTAVLTTGAVTVSPSSIASAEAFGSAMVSVEGGTQFINAEGIASSEAFGEATLTPGAVTVTAEAIASAEAFGSAVVSAAGTVLAPASIDSAEAFGDAVLTVGAVTVAPTAIASAEAFGSATVTGGEEAPATIVIGPAGMSLAGGAGMTLTGGATGDLQ